MTRHEKKISKFLLGDQMNTSVKDCKWRTNPLKPMKTDDSYCVVTPPCDHHKGKQLKNQ